jgi:Mrp family chromosome partitioning ATPase
MWPPRKGLLLPVALLGGLGFGTALAFLLEAVRRSRPHGAPSLSETRPLASALRPEARIEPVRAVIARAPRRTQSADNDVAAGPLPQAAVEAFAFADLRGATGAAFTPARLATAMIDNPAAPVSRQLNQLYLSLRRSAPDGAPRSVLIVPDRHSPMKSEVALGLAVAGGMAGDRVLLIDADGASRTLSETLCPDARTGLGDVLAGRARLADAVVSYPETSIEILASTVSAKAARIELATFSAMLKSATAYDLVVIDGAPLGHRHSSLAAAHSVSDILFAIGPGGASHGDSGDFLASTLRATPKFRGIVLTD